VQQVSASATHCMVRRNHSATGRDHPAEIHAVARLQDASTNVQTRGQCCEELSASISEITVRSSQSPVFASKAVSEPIAPITIQGLAEAAQR